MLKVDEYKYTNEELDFIEKVHDAESIRGATIRWWEDVRVGDELQPVVNGPLTCGTRYWKLPGWVSTFLT